MSNEDSQLLEKAKKFENLLDTLENRQIIFSKKQLEDYHSQMEGEIDTDMSEFEDSIIRENSDKGKSPFYEKLFNFLRS